MQLTLAFTCLIENSNYDVGSFITFSIISFRMVLWELRGGIQPVLKQYHTMAQSVRLTALEVQQAVST